VFQVVQAGWKACPTNHPKKLRAVFPLRVVALACIISTAESAETAEFFSQILRFSALFARFAVKFGTPTRNLRQVESLSYIR